jgi:RND family efflux transporter MFP subunit
MKTHQRCFADAAALAAVAAVLATPGCDRERLEPTVAAQATVDVTTGTVTSADLPELYDAGGVVRARTTAAITSRLLAPVQEVHVNPGSSVHRGQVLVRLEDRDLAAQQRRAAAGRVAAEEGGRAAEAEREAARSALALATAHHKRISLLHERKSATDDELDQAVAGLRTSAARVAATNARVAEAAAVLAAASANADAARAGASWAVITAPFDGVITEKLVEPGNMAAPGMPLLRMEEGGAMRVDVRLDESRAAGVTAGDEVDVLLDRVADRAGAAGPAFQGTRTTARRLTGCVVEIARAAEAGAHAFLVKVDLPPGLRVPSGAFAHVYFSGPSRNVLVVPRAALVRRGQLTSVFVVDGDRVRVRLVNAGDVAQGSAAGVLEVLSGLDAGDRVVIDPPPALRDSAHVRIQSGVAGARDGGPS